MTGLRGVPYAMSQASYDLVRLRGNGLIERIARTNTYRLTAAPPPSAPPGTWSPDISTAPSPPPGSGARPEPLPPPLVSRAPGRKLGSTVKSSRLRALDGRQPQDPARLVDRSDIQIVVAGCACSCRPSAHCR